MVFADDRHGPGVVGAVTAAAFAVVVGRVRIEAGATVVGVAFTRFRFFGFGGFEFFSCFGSFPRALPGRDLSRVPPRRRATLLGSDSVRFAMAMSRSRLSCFQRRPLSRFPPGARCFAAGPTSSRNQSQSEAKGGQPTPQARF
jgi:hypothetical protein